MVQLAHTGSKLTTAGTGRRNDHQFAAGFNKLILAVTLITNDVADIGGVTLNSIVMVDLHTHRLQPGLEGLRQNLTIVAGQHHGAHVQAESAEHIDQSNHIPVIGNAQITTDLVLFDIVRIDSDHDLHHILQLQQHTQLTIRLESGQDTGRVVIVV